MGKKIQVLLLFQNVFSWLRDEDPVDRGRSWLWIWGDCLEKPGLGAVVMGGGSWKPHLAHPGLVEWAGSEL